MPHLRTAPWLLLHAWAAAWLWAAGPAAAQRPVSGGDVFAGQSQPAFGQSPAVCGDPQIARIEAQSNTTARVMGPREAAFGRWLEQSGYVYHAGVCRNQAGSVVMFIHNQRLGEANRAWELFASGSAPRSGSPVPGPSSAPRTMPPRPEMPAQGGFPCMNPPQGGRTEQVRGLPGGALCVLRANDELWCRQRTAYSGNAFLPTNAAWPLKPVGVRVLPNCEIVASAGSGGPPPPPPRPAPAPSPPPQQAGVETICDMRRLAAYAFGGYYDARPVARVRVTNGTAPDTYLILLSGMQPRLGGSTNLPDALIALFNVQALDSYRLAIMDAVQDLPRGSTLILVGHSQGGMEAQNVVHNLTDRWSFKVPQVITFGAPVSTSKHGETQYLHLRERRDPIPAVDRQYDLTAVRLFSAQRRVSSQPWDPDGAHLVYDKAGSGLETMALPPIEGINGHCLEVDMKTLVRRDAPQYFTRMFTRPANQRFAGLTPRNPDMGFSNCFWVSLAQDRYWREGIPYYAMCEKGPIPPAERDAVLVRQYGGLDLDDALGPTPADAIRRHRNGQFAFTTRAGLEAALLRTGMQSAGALTGNGGIVHVQQPGAKIGHVFNVRLKPNGTIEYTDAQAPVNPMDHFKPDTEVFYYRTF